MRAVTDATFETDVLRADRPVLVEFGAPWCRPCDALAPVLEALAAEHGLGLVSLDVDANLGTPSRYGVLSLPTTILFEGGEARATVVGARGRKHLERAFAGWLSS